MVMLGVPVVEGRGGGCIVLIESLLPRLWRGSPPFAEWTSTGDSNVVAGRYLGVRDSDEAGLMYESTPAGTGNV